MPEDPSTEVVVIGAGAVGLCCAYYLTEAGYRVRVLEQNEIGSGASHGNAGLIVPSHVVPLAAPKIISRGLRWMLDPRGPFYIRPRPDLGLIRWLMAFRRYCNDDHVRRSVPVFRQLNRTSLRLFEDLVQKEGLDFGFEKKGLIYLYTHEEELRRAAEEASELCSAGFDITLLNRGRVRDLEPSVSDRVIGGIFHAEAAQGIPDRFVSVLRDLLAARGVTFETEIRVRSFRGEGGRITDVQTSKGSRSGDSFVLATGAWTAWFSRNLGTRLPIQPGKGYSLTVDKPGKQIPQRPLILAEAMVAVTPMGDRLRFSGTLELAGLDLSIHKQRIEGITRAAETYLSTPRSWGSVETWAGLRPCSPDGLPLIGFLEGYENLVVATGHTKMGFALGPVTGKIVADLLSGKGTDRDLEAVSPNRFG